MSRRSKVRKARGAAYPTSLGGHRLHTRGKGLHVAGDVCDSTQGGKACEECPSGPALGPHLCDSAPAVHAQRASAAGPHVSCPALSRLHLSRVAVGTTTVFHTVFVTGSGVLGRAGWPRRTRLVRRCRTTRFSGHPPGAAWLCLQCHSMVRSRTPCVDIPQCDDTNRIKPLATLHRAQHSCLRHRLYRSNAPQSACRLCHTLRACTAAHRGTRCCHRVAERSRAGLMPHQQ